MFSAARAALELHTRTSTKYSLAKIPAKDLPNQYTLRELFHELCAFPGESLDNNIYNAMILESCLHHQSRITKTPSDPECFQEILGSLAKLIMPSGHFNTLDEFPEDDSSAARALALQQLRLVSKIALSAISNIHAQPVFREMDVDPAFLLSLLAYTNTDDPWVSEETQKLALELLNMHQKQILVDSFIVDYILQGSIRPLFSGYRHPTVTSEGRKALNQMPKNHRSSAEQEPSDKPWKFRDAYAVTVFGWAARNAEEAIIHKNWHLFIPPLLTIIDDPSIYIRVRGLCILNDLLSKTSAKVLEQTGLGEVFEDAVMPTLLFLPSLTTAEDPQKLLKSAYAVLFKLGDTLFPTDEKRPGKLKLLDRIMRQGVLQGFLYSRDNVDISELLIKEAGALICIMRIHAVKYLKDIIPLLSKILTEPFGPSQPSLLLATVKTTQNTILNCWPRMIETIHRNELIKALAVCWATVNEEAFIKDDHLDSQLETVKKELRLTGRILVKSLEEQLDIVQELEPLAQVDPSISELFGIDAGGIRFPLRS